MCFTLESNAMVKESTVDDWGRYGNFSILIVPACHDRHTTVRIKALVKKSLPRGASLREVFGPDPIKDYNPYTRTSKIVGYSRKFWVIDVDYQTYHAETNSFGGACAASGQGSLVV